MRDDQKKKKVNKSYLSKLKRFRLFGIGQYIILVKFIDLLINLSLLLEKFSSGLACFHINVHV